VLEAKIGGDREEQVEIVIDPLLLESYGISPDDVTATVARSNRLIAAGALDTGRGRFAIKVPGVFDGAADILDMPVKVSGDAAVRVRDVAEVRRTFKDPESFARLNGRPAIALEVSKPTTSGTCCATCRTTSSAPCCW
jgi:multidrug efflux pump